MIGEASYIGAYGIIEKLVIQFMISLYPFGEIRISKNVDV